MRLRWAYFEKRIGQSTLFLSNEVRLEGIGRYVMKEYQVSAKIELDKNRLIEFKCPFEISSSDNQIKNIKINSETGKIAVNYTILADSDKEAEERVLLQLTCLTDRISFKENIPIKDKRITGISWQKTEGSKISIGVADFVRVKGNLRVKKSLSETSINQLKKFLEKPLKPQIEEYLLMYRQALSEESIVSRFFLLYRILEKIIGKYKIDKWIENVEPNIIKVKNRQGKYVTIYKHLRDNIHPKQARFPYKEISNYVPRLTDLARKAIVEKVA